MGAGIWRSLDGGDAWSRVRPTRVTECDIRSLAVHPTDPSILYAGIDSGLYRSENRGGRWERLDSPMNSMHTWAIGIDPDQPDTIFVGTKPSALFRSKDGGERWERLPVGLAEECPSTIIPRVTVLVFDPEDHRTIWAGIEVDGLRRSTDGGDTWTAISGGVEDPDIHGVAIVMGKPKRVLVTTPREIFVSTDGGEEWRRLEMLKLFPYKYARPIRVKEDDPRVICVGNGTTAAVSPTIGSVQRSPSDAGDTWETLPLEANSNIECLATHPSDPDLIVACSLYGQVFWTEDGGDSWRKTPQEFGEVRSLVWMPTA